MGGDLISFDLKCIIQAFGKQSVKFDREIKTRYSRATHLCVQKNLECVKVLNSFRLNRRQRRVQSQQKFSVLHVTLYKDKVCFWANNKDTRRKLPHVISRTSVFGFWWSNGLRLALPVQGARV